MLSLLGVLSISLLLGLKHALEPDHVIGVATVSSQKKSLRSSLQSAFYWGLGHTLTIAIVALVMFLLGKTIAENAESYEIFVWFERGVGIMLIGLGIKLFYDLYSGKKLHTHDNEGKEHKHVIKGRTDFQSLLIGGIHGLAGSGAVVAVVAAELDNFAEYFIYIFLFGVGSVFGMMIATGVISLPFLTKKKNASVSEKIMRVVMMISGIVSILFGAFVLWELR